MKKWKRYGSLLLALLMCLSMTACGDGKKDGSGDVIPAAPDVLEDLGPDDSAEYDYSAYLGTWEDGQGNVLTVEKRDDGQVYYQLLDVNGDPNARGALQYVKAYDSVYVHNEFDGAAYLFRFDADELVFEYFGTYTKAGGGTAPVVVDDADVLPVKVEGRWRCSTVDPYQYIEFDAEGNWKLYFDECNVADSGYLRYEPEEDVIYICSDVGGAMDGSYYIEVDGETLTISAGYVFSYDGFAPYEGVWLCESTDQCDYLVFDDDGDWQLQLEGKVIDEGYLWYAGEQALYICSTQGSDMDGCSIDAPEDGRLLFSGYGRFACIDESSIEWIDDGTGNGNEYYSWNAKLHQRNVSEFEGVWYYQEDLSADTYIVIDSEGNWSYYQRAPGDAEGTEMDHGTFSYSKDEGSVYYADSAVYDGVSYWVMEFDDDILIWDYDDIYYRME